MERSTDLLTEIANDKEIEALCRNISKHHYLWRDLYQQLMLTLCEMGNERLNKERQRGNIRYFIVSVARNIQRNATRRSSPLYQYADRANDVEGVYAESEEYNKDIDIMHDKVHQLIEQMKTTKEDWYMATIFEQYRIEGSTRKLAAKTGIKFRSIALTVRNFKERAKKELAWEK